MIKPLIALLGALLLGGCQATDPLSGENDPKDHQWSLDFFGPNYMTGWVEASLVEDINGQIFKHGRGIIGTGTPGYRTETARGWVGGVGGNIIGVAGADLPKRIFVRWQSVVEPQTYRAWVEIPEEARQIMHTSTHRRCPKTPEQEASFIASVHLGLAPGGIVQVWVRDECSHAVKVARAQAEIEPLGPSQGLTEGRYAHKISEDSQRYIEKYGIPYGSW